jgi:hypothetical protein
MMQKLCMLVCFIATIFQLKAQDVYNPFTQNIHFEPEPTSSGFACGSETELVFTQGLTTIDDATQWSTNPLIVKIDFQGFQINGNIQQAISGFYAVHFNWVLNATNANQIVGTQKENIVGTGMDPMDINPNSSGSIRIKLKVPASSINSTILSAHASLQLPAYMATYNSTPDDDESIQTQAMCGNSMCNTKPNIIVYPDAAVCEGEHILLKAKSVIGSQLSWQFPSAQNAQVNILNTLSTYLDIDNMQQANAGQYIVFQTIAGCNKVLSDTLNMVIGKIPVVDFVTTSCNANQASITVNMTSPNTHQFSLNGGFFQTSNQFQTISNSPFVIAVKSITNQCTAFYEGVCTNCNPTNNCTQVQTIIPHIPKLACVGGSIAMSAFVQQVNQLTWSSEGGGLFTTNVCSATNCQTDFTPSQSEINQGYAVITLLANDPDGAGSCEAKMCKHLIRFINGFVPLNVSSNAPICAGESLMFNATNASFQTKLLNPNGVAYSFNQQLTLPNVANQVSGVFSVVHEAQGCQSLIQNIVVNILQAPNLQVDVTKQNEFCAGNGNGFIDVSIAQGSGNYHTYLNSTSSNQFIGNQIHIPYLSPNQYQIKVIDMQCPTLVFSYSTTIESGRVVTPPVVNNMLQVCDGNSFSLNAQTNANQTFHWTKYQSMWQANGNQIYFSKANMTHTGLYYVKSIDADGCASQAQAIQIDVHPQPFIQSVGIECLPNATAKISINANVASGSLLYGLDSIQYQNTNVLMTTQTGTKAVFVKSNYGCIMSADIDLPNCNCPNPSQLQVSYPINACANSLIPIQIACINASSASISSNGSGWLSATSGISPFNVTYMPSANDVAIGEVEFTIATNDHDGTGPCLSSTKKIKINVFQALPNVVLSTSQNQYCVGDTIHILSNVAGSLTWQNPQQNVMQGNLLQINGATQLAEGNYVATMLGNGCQSVSASIFIQINPLPVLTISSSILPEVCEGQGNGQISMTINGGSGHYSIKNELLGHLFQGKNPVILKWIPAGNYDLQIADLACRNSATPHQVDLPNGLHVDAPLVVSYNAPICEGENLILTANDSGIGEFEWQYEGIHFSQNGNEIIRANAQPNMSGLYRIRRIVNGCASEAKLLDVHVSSMPLIQTINKTCGSTFDDAQLEVVANVTGNDDMEYAINEGAFQSNALFSNLTNGLYKISVRSKASDCVVRMSDVVLHCDCDCEDGNKIAIFPNPNDGMFSLNASLQQADASGSITIHDLLGKAIFSKTIQGENYKVNESIATEGLSNGMYLVRIELDQKKYSLPIHILK